MGRSYAGVLGLVAFATLVARGVATSATASSTLPMAAAALAVFAAVGYVLGRIAEYAIAADLKAQFQAELARLQAEAVPPDSKPT